MKKNSKKNIVIGILLIIVVVLIGFILMSKNIAKNTYSSVSGIYSTNETLNIDDENMDISFTLYLLDDGTFKYEYSAYAPVGVIGNYIIDGDTIILNYMFSTNSGTDLEVTSGTKKLTISKDNKIIDNNYQYKEDNSNIESIKLENKGDINSDFDWNNVLKSGIVDDIDNTVNNIKYNESDFIRQTNITLVDEPNCNGNSSSLVANIEEDGNISISQSGGASIVTPGNAKYLYKVDKLACDAVSLYYITSDNELYVLDNPRSDIDQTATKVIEDEVVEFLGTETKEVKDGYNHYLKVLLSSGEVEYINYLTAVK